MTLRLIRKSIFSFVILMLLLSAALPTFARAEKLEETYSDEFITFNYPADWFTCSCPDTHNMMAIGNTEDAPNSSDLGRDEVQVLMVKNVSVFIDEMFELDFDATSPKATLEDYFNGQDIETDRFDGRRVAWMHVENRQERIDSLFIVIELGDDEPMGMMIATARRGDLEQFEDTIIAISQTLVATSTLEDRDVTEGGSKTDQSGDKDSAANDIELNESFEMRDADLSLAYPEGWLIDEDDGAVFLGSTEDAFNIRDLNDLKRRDLVMMIVPTTDGLTDYPDEIDNGTRPSTIVSYYASMAMIDGFVQNGAMDEPVIGDGKLEASSVYSTREGDYDQYVLAIETEDGDIITVFAYAASGKMENFIPTIEAIAATFSIR